MDTQKNLLVVVGEWLQQRQTRRQQHQQDAKQISRSMEMAV